MKTNTPSSKVVLISWVSVNHGAAPLLQVIKHRASPLRHSIHRLYLCWRRVSSNDGAREQEALKRTQAEVKEALDPICPEIILCPWETDAPPTDHAAIRPFAESVLRRARSENPESAIAIHLSPGTPAMHAIWLLLGSTGFIDGEVQLLQSTDKDEKSPVKRLNFDVDTWLKRYRATRPAHVSDGDRGHLWDPAQVKSPALKQTLDQLREWAPLRVPVLLMGERGTGKTTLANLLRSLGPYQHLARSDWPAVVCGQFRVNPQLARSELFGHAKGAFTGATSERKGLLEQADGDCLFLDEIADIDRDTQRLLMAAIEGRGFQRLGESKTRQSNFRLISATNRTQAELSDDIIDPDFYDRIGYFVLTVPPLRECREDIPDAWSKVLERATDTAAIKPDGWQYYQNHPEVIKELIQSPLSGNFRDLQKSAYHLLAAVMADKPETSVLEALKASLSCSEITDFKMAFRESLDKQLPIDLKSQLYEYEAYWIDAAMRRANGNVTAAAEMLGLPRKTLDNRMRSARNKEKEAKD
jgi:DNA-binding NtrC family response regulator